MFQSCFPGVDLEIIFILLMLAKLSLVIIDFIFSLIQQLNQCVKSYVGKFIQT